MQRARMLLRTLCLTLLVILLFAALPTALAQSQELINNGGFESQFTGWIHSNSRVVSASDQGYNDAMSHPPHSGRYSAEVGSASASGKISQTVTIPAKSQATFSAWYRLEQGASLSIYLKNSDGSTIKQWSESGSQTWTSVSYDVGAGYAGKSVIVEFDGQGNQQVVTVPAYCVDASGNYYYCPYYSYADYFPFIDDVSLKPAIVEYSANVSVAGFPQDLSSRLYVDGTQVGQVNGGQSMALSFKIGDTHKISIDTYVYVDNATRYHCVIDTQTVTTDTKVSFAYSPQYFLRVDTPYGASVGSDWYDAGSNASFSLTTGSVPMQGFLGLLGGRFIFDKWTGDSVTGSMKSEISMDGPKQVSASWKADYSLLYLVVAFVVALVVGAFMAYTRLAKKHKRREGTKVYDLEVSTQETEPITIDAATEDKLTKHRETSDRLAEETSHKAQSSSSEAATSSGEETRTARKNGRRKHHS